MLIEGKNQKSTYKIIVYYWKNSYLFVKVNTNFFNLPMA
jgi:hypothetical protein